MRSDRRISSFVSALAVLIAVTCPTVPMTAIGAEPPSELQAELQHYTEELQTNQKIQKQKTTTDAQREVLRKRAAKLEDLINSLNQQIGASSRQ